MYERERERVCVCDVYRAAHKLHIDFPCITSLDLLNAINQEKLQLNIKSKYVYVMVYHIYISIYHTYIILLYQMHFMYLSLI